MNSYLLFCLLTVAFFLLLIVYFKVALKYNIIDRPNDRSSHIHPTIRGGGIIFPIAALIWSVLNGFAFPYVIIAVLLSGFVSFVDDIRSLPNSVRFMAHALSSLMILYQVGLFALSPLWIGLVLIIIIGVINAYNFMDGINGITGFYSLAVIAPLYFSEADKILQEFELYIMLSLGIFLFFNARKKARCFAGDVGSICIAIIICFLLLLRIISTNNLGYIIFLLVYGLDTAITIIQRLYLKENIFKAHRRHLFQLLSNEMKLPHLVVSMSFALIQLVINISFLQFSSSVFLISLIILGAAVYCIVKFFIHNKLKSSISRI